MRHFGSKSRSFKKIIKLGRNINCVKQFSTIKINKYLTYHKMRNSTGAYDYQAVTDDDSNLTEVTV